LKELLRDKLMEIKNSGKKYTVADIYQEAGKMLKGELSALKHQSLSPQDEAKIDKLGKLLSKMVLKEMDLI